MPLVPVLLRYEIFCFDTVDEPKSDGGADATKVNVSSHRNVMKVCGDGTSLPLYTDGIRSRGAMQLHDVNT